MQTYHRDVSSEQRAETLIQGLSLDYGMGYGRAYYTATNEKVLKAILSQIDIKSFADLALLFSNPEAMDFLLPKDIKDAAHLTAVVNRLAAVTPLNKLPTESSTRKIEVADFLQTKQVVYFNLKSAQRAAGDGIHCAACPLVAELLRREHSCPQSSRVHARGRVPANHRR